MSSGYSGVVVVSGSTGFTSTVNSTTTPLSGGATYTGTWEDINQYASIVVIASADVAGTLYVDFSADGSTTARAVQLSDGTSGSLGIHALTKVARYYRVRVVNGGSAQSSFSVQTTLDKADRVAKSRMNQSLTDYSDVQNVRSALVGKDDGGNFRSVPITGEGHLEVEVHGPRTAFGEVRVAELTPLVQASFPYGINPEQWDTWTSAGGTVSASGGLATVSINTTADAFARLRTKRRLHYRPGQGGVARFTAVIPAGAANSQIVVGPITEESGWAFGRNGTAYGVLYRTGGQRNIRTLTVTVGAGGAENATVTLDGSTKVVALVSGSTTSTAYQLASADYSATGDGWDAAQVGATVVFIARRAKVTLGAFTLTSTGTAAGTFADTTAGVAPTNTWTPQASWDDPMTSGTGSTGVVLDPTKGQVYEITYQYLGFGPIFYKIESQPAGENNPSFATVYTRPYLNLYTTPSMKIPSQPFAVEVRSLGSTTALSVSCASVLLGVDGKDEGGVDVNPISGNLSSVGTTELPIFSVRNGLTWAGSQTNQTGKRLRKIYCSVKGATNAIVTVRIRRGATLTGTPNFAIINSGVSAAYLDTAATGVSGGTVVWQTAFAETTGNAEFDVSDETQLYMEPGDVYTVTAQASSGASTIVTVTLESREYQ